ncbi:Oidioi.mRNA.OKI2018_I69.chr1.g1362.t1.cds [Oikopleura dioica]|uniref:Oidioi.mRNA.OKI2018_I69.chr1.g1362.t1.cds n=1 Tax=Oikopleura dioica TaxID=34765 RepID=A0ABN7SSP6_OIKDI|nr:Oidioi.mRNA.OKI2018_I69.chr1.g1362.t1.cds [Oikopleura dioica]
MEITKEEMMKEDKEENGKKKKKKVSWCKNVYLFSVPYYNRKCKSLDIDKIKDKAREKIKIELDNFKDRRTSPKSIEDFLKL